MCIPSDKRVFIPILSGSTAATTSMYVHRSIPFILHKNTINLHGMKYHTD